MTTNVLFVWESEHAFLPPHPFNIAVRKRNEQVQSVRLGEIRASLLAK
jgi:hypothetical protein